MLEVAARPIGGLCAKVLPGLEELILRHAAGEDTSKFVLPAEAAGVMMIPVPQSGILEKIEGSEEALAIPGICEIQITARLHDFIAAWPEGSSYLGFIFASGSTPDLVEAALRQAHRSLQFKITPRLPVAHPVCLC